MNCAAFSTAAESWDESSASALLVFVGDMRCPVRKAYARTLGAECVDHHRSNGGGRHESATDGSPGHCTHYRRVQRHRAGAGPLVGSEWSSSHHRCTRRGAIENG